MFQSAVTQDLFYSKQPTLDEDRPHSDSKSHLQARPPLTEDSMPYSREFQVLFKGLPMLVILEAQSQSLVLTIVNQQQLHVWRAEFKSGYLQEISAKTGAPCSYLGFVQMLIEALEAGSAHTYIDFLDMHDLQLLKGKMPSARQQQDLNVPQKRYLILTSLQEAKKFHYPLPMAPLDTNTPQSLDKETLRFLLTKMRVRLKNQSQALDQSAYRSTQSFFSRENKSHPSVLENEKLQERLTKLQRIKNSFQSRVSTPTDSQSAIRSLQTHRSQLEQQQQEFQGLSQRELERLRSQQIEIESAISTVKSNLDDMSVDYSHRPSTSSSRVDQNATLTSNFTIETVDVDELRQQLAQSSFELEEQKLNFRKQMAKHQKEIEIGYEQLDQIAIDEKKVRVKMNQIEVDLEHQLKRLIIVCKSKGLPKPTRPSCLPDKPNRSAGNYVSPYNRGPGGSTGAKSGAGRSLSNGSNNRFGNNYTPPNKRNPSIGSNKSAKSNNPQQARVQSRFSPLGSNGQKNSPATSVNNRMYSPSGRRRNEDQSPQAYAAHNSNNRVRREPAVSNSLGRGGSENRSNNSNNRTRAQEYAAQLAAKRKEAVERRNSKPAVANNNNLVNSRERPAGTINTYIPQQRPILNKPTGLATSTRYNAGGSRQANADLSMIGKQVKEEGAVDAKINMLQQLLSNAKS